MKFGNWRPMKCCGRWALFWAARLPPGKGEFKNKITMIAVSLAVFGCTFALMGLSRVFWVYLIFDCICGMFVPVLIASETVLIQTNTEKGIWGVFLHCCSLFRRG